MGLDATDDTLNRVRAVLNRRKDVVEKTMMGSRAFMVGGSMCCAVGPKGLLVRVTPAQREALLAKPHVTPMRLGARTMAGFVRVAAEGCRADPELETWIDLGITASRAASKKSDTKKAAKKRVAKKSDTKKAAKKRVAKKSDTKKAAKKRIAKKSDPKKVAKKRVAKLPARAPRR